MLRNVLIISTVMLLSSSVYAQGGIGSMPREDIVKLRAVVRDSLSNVVYEHIVMLKDLALAGNIDSAAKYIAHNGGATKEGRWARAVDMNNPDEAARAAQLVEKLRKLFTELPDMIKEYYAVFKDADNPAGQKHLYQISRTNGKTKKMTSFTFFPVGEEMMLGEVY